MISVLICIMLLNLSLDINGDWPGVSDTREFLMRVPIIEINASNNIEYCEYVNELFFLHLEKSPDVFIETLEEIKNSDAKKYRQILMELSHPINDLIDIHSIYNKVLEVHSNSAVKQQLLDMLKTLNTER